MELEELRERVLLMASRAETAVNQSVQALTNREHDPGELVCDSGEPINPLVFEIDQGVIVLLRKAPLATDLRLVTVGTRFFRCSFASKLSFIIKLRRNQRITKLDPDEFLH
jgi:phosphate transport system protein